MLRSQAMTIGQLSRRTGVPIKVLREYEALGFLYTLGRSESNYRLFGEEALWSVRVVQSLRSLGLTLKEIQAFTTSYREQQGQPIDPLLDAHLAQALARIEGQIAQLQGCVSVSWNSRRCGPARWPNSPPTPRHPIWHTCWPQTHAKV
ncbi:MAG TPA: MerR family transcriptional regulator [Ktedonobacterales bacterium]|jgi:DNA-binding transcriptional MerR regulator